MKIVRLGPSSESQFARHLVATLRKRLRGPAHLEVRLFFDVLPWQLVTHRLKRLVRRFRLRKSVSHPMNVLIRLEPEVVVPSQYRLHQHDFDYVFDVGFRNSSPFPWPQDPESLRLRERTLGLRLNQVCMISANKFSPVEQELYSLRKLFALKDSRIHLYGRGWDVGFSRKLLTAVKSLAFAVRRPSLSAARKLIIWLRRNPESKGEVIDKFETYQKYKYALIIENDSTYVSEKLFDALAAGCLPIYVGPVVISEQWIESLIVRSNATLKGLDTALELAFSWDYDDWLLQLKTAFVSKNLEAHHFKRVVSAISEHISELALAHNDEEAFSPKAPGR